MVSKFAFSKCNLYGYVAGVGDLPGDGGKLRDGVRRVAGGARRGAGAAAGRRQAAVVPAGGRAALTPGCHIGYMDYYTGCHQLNRVLTVRVVTPGCQIGYMDY